MDMAIVSKYRDTYPIMKVPYHYTLEYAIHRGKIAWTFRRYVTSSDIFSKKSLKIGRAGP